jgi:hypothetical protein
MRCEVASSLRRPPIANATSPTPISTRTEMWLQIRRVRRSSELFDNDDRSSCRGNSKSSACDWRSERRRVSRHRPCPTARAAAKYDVATTHRLGVSCVVCFGFVLSSFVFVVCAFRTGIHTHWNFAENPHHGSIRRGICCTCNQNFPADVLV